ncbi:MAG TPA: SRPBCC family protein [Solirubrobacteraceae bacterium]|nr:SRPBCC family protein [Solirubrobacteraceae bacterium]
MRARHVQIEHDFAKAPERIFAYLAEHENLAEVFGAKVTRLCDGDDGERNGVGSVRKLQIGPLPPFEETVTEFDAPRRIVYRITKGSPLRGHVGVMEFSPTVSGGTRFVYDIRIASAVPGLAPIVCAALTRSVEQSLDSVERQA